MKVWILLKRYSWSEDYDGEDIIGIYDTPEKAHNKIETLEKPPKIGYGMQFIYIVVEVEVE